jgi:hypothetical protein
MERSLLCHYRGRDPDRAEFGLCGCLADGFLLRDDDSILSSLMYLGLLQLDLRWHSAAYSNLDLARILAERLDRPMQLTIITWAQVAVLLDWKTNTATLEATRIIEKASRKQGIMEIPWRRSMIQHAASRIAKGSGDLQESRARLDEATQSYVEHRKRGGIPTGMRAMQVSNLADVLQASGLGATGRAIDEAPMPPDLRSMLFELLDRDLVDGFSFYRFAWIGELVELHAFAALAMECRNRGPQPAQ